MSNFKRVDLGMGGPSGFVEISESFPEEPTRPSEIDGLVDFPKIQELVHNEWGTIRLKEYLGELLADTMDADGNLRRGFPQDIANVLLELSISNMEYLEEHGVLSDSPVSEFALTDWQLPKNF